MAAATKADAAEGLGGVFLAGCCQAAWLELGGVLKDAGQQLRGVGGGCNNVALQRRTAHMFGSWVVPWTLCSHPRQGSSAFKGRSSLSHFV